MCIRDSCASCKEHEEQFCENGMTGTYNSMDRYGDGTVTHGGYSTSIVVNEDFVLRIPEGMPLDRTAPLLCAGITTYSPLHRFGVKAGHKLGVVGLGGLGHMAVKIAKAMGAVSYTHLRAHETVLDLVCRLLLEKKNLKFCLSAISSRNTY